MNATTCLRQLVKAAHRAVRLQPSLRPYSLLTASPRSPLLTTAIRQQKIVHERWKHTQTLPTEQHEQTLASESSPPSSRIETENTASTPEPEAARQEVPSYEITFTCKPCSTRSTHKISKQGYHKGTILITCPECKNRHLICDHLKIFRDESTTIEDIIREKGELVKRGTLGVDGDIEIWDDGSTTAREAAENSGQAPVLDATSDGLKT